MIIMNFKGENWGVGGGLVEKDWAVRLEEEMGSVADEMEKQRRIYITTNLTKINFCFFLFSYTYIVTFGNYIKDDLNVSILFP